MIADPTCQQQDRRQGWLTDAEADLPEAPRGHGPDGKAGQVARHVDQAQGAPRDTDLQQLAADPSGLGERDQPDRAA